MYEYYFALSGMGEDEEGKPCDAFMKVAFPFSFPDEAVKEYIILKMPSLTGKIRPITREEYDEVEEDSNAKAD